MTTTVRRYVGWLSVGALLIVLVAVSIREEPPSHQTLLDSIDLPAASDAALTQEAALANFARVYGPLSGTRGGGNSTLPVSGTTAVTAVMGFWTGYTGAQRDAIIALAMPELGSSADEDRGADSHGGRANGTLAAIGARTVLRLAQVPFGRSPSDRDRWYRERALGHAREISNRTGIPEPKIEVLTGQDLGSEDGSPVAANATPWKRDVRSQHDSGFLEAWREPMELCRIRFSASLDTRRYLWHRAQAIAHEVFHCFQFAVVRGEYSLLHGAPWVKEGLAEWASQELVPPGRDILRESWLTTPSQRSAAVRRSVYDNSYEAVGFFMTLNAISGVDLWQSFPPIVRAANGHFSALNAAAEIGGDRFLATLATSALRRPDLGEAWGWRIDEVNFPLQPQWRWRPQHRRLRIGAPVTIDLYGGESTAYRIRPIAREGAILTLHVEGRAGVGASWLRAGQGVAASSTLDDVPMGDTSEERWCVGERCRCGELGQGVGVAPGDTLMVAVQAALPAVAATAGGITLSADLERLERSDEDCEEEPEDEEDDRPAGRRSPNPSHTRKPDDLCRNDWLWLNQLCESIQRNIR